MPLTATVSAALLAAIDLGGFGWVEPRIAVQSGPTRYYSLTRVVSDGGLYAEHSLFAGLAGIELTAQARFTPAGVTPMLGLSATPSAWVDWPLFLTIVGYFSDLSTANAAVRVLTVYDLAIGPIYLSGFVDADLCPERQLLTEHRLGVALGRLAAWAGWRYAPFRDPAHGAMIGLELRP